MTGSDNVVAEGDCRACVVGSLSKDVDAVFDVDGALDVPNMDVGVPNENGSVPLRNEMDRGSDSSLARADDDDSAGGSNSFGRPPYRTQKQSVSIILASKRSETHPLSMHIRHQLCSPAITVVIL